MRPGGIIARLASPVILLLGLGVFGYASSMLRHAPRPQVAPELEVALPLFIQVGMAGGDRYLAANGAAIRTLITNTMRMGENEYAILARLQEDVSWMNPAHEDNYYTAAAILPWNGQLDTAQTILRRATLARPYDYQPAFFYAFDLLYFKRDPVAAAEWLGAAAQRLPEGDEKLAMQNYAARWMERDKDLDNAIAVISAMARQARRADFRAYLQLRVERMQTLKMLREKAVLYKQRYGRSIHDVSDLVAAGVIAAVPPDPFNFGYEVGKDGLISLRSEPKQ